MGVEGDNVWMGERGEMANIVALSAISLMVGPASLNLATVCTTSITGSAQLLPPTMRYIWLKHSPVVGVGILSRMSTIFALDMQHTSVLVNFHGSIFTTRLLPNTKKFLRVLDVGERSVRCYLRAVISYTKSVLCWRNFSFSFWKFWPPSFKSLIYAFLSLNTLLVMCYPVNRVTYIFDTMR